MKTQIKVFTFNPFQENTYVLWDENKNACIIDPGCYAQRERDELTNFIKHKGLKISRIFNTHCHLDHVFGNDFVSETYGVPVEIHRGELPVLARAHVAGEMYGVPMSSPQTPTHFLEENDVVEIGDIALKVLFVPGHSPAHICFYNAKENFLIGGDVLFYGSIGRTDLPGGNHDLLISNIKTKIFTLPDETVVHSGHGGSTTVGFERLNNPFF